jgi:hypothetical protein
MDQEMQALHMAAVQAGTARVVCHIGDAEGHLWNAPRWRVVRRSVRAGALRNEFHVLLDGAGRPLAWWQRSSGTAANGAPWELPYAVPNLTVHAIDGQAHGLGVEMLIDELAHAAGCNPRTYRQALMPMPGRVSRIQPAAAGVWLNTGTVAPSPGAGPSVSLSVS